MRLLNKDERKYFVQSCLLAGFAIGVGAWALFDAKPLAVVGGLCGILFGGMLIQEQLE